MEARKEITITSGIGEGSTALSAFDNALYSCGIGNYNLLHLSSVIPKNHRPILKQVNSNETEQGDRLYVVYAAHGVERLGETAAAGLGWCVTQGDEPWGLFVEHVGDSQKSVQAQIEASLAHMTSYRASEQWGEVHSHIIEAQCTTQPVCAISVARFHSERWPS